MKLFNIEEEACCVCNARVEMEKQSSLHCNGQWNETRSFECGRVVHYSPNFRAIEVQKECPKHPTILDIERKRKEAVSKLVDYIDNMDCDAQFKLYISNSVQHIF